MGCGLKAEKNDACRLVPRFLLPRWQSRQQVCDLIGFCTEISADEMMLFPVSQFIAGDSEAEALEERAKRIAGIRKQAGRAGVNVIINHCGFMDDTLNLDGEYSRRWPWSVDINGHEAVGYRCVLAEDVREGAARELRALAQSGVDKIFLDDEVHHDWKPGCGRSEGTHFCFCDRHLDGFSRRIGRKISREELADSLKRNKPADKTLRRQWLEFKRKVFLAFLEYCREHVHKEFPDVRIGQMTTFAHLAAWEGVTFGEHVTALAGSLQGLCRPAQGWYGDHDRTGLLLGLAQTMWTAHCLPKGVEVYSEVDWGSPWTQLQNSARMAGDFQIKANLLLNIKTHSLLYLGEGPDDDFIRGRLTRQIKQSRRVFDGLAKHIPADAPRVGLQFIMGEKMGYDNPMGCRGWEGDLADPFALTGEGLGLPGWNKAFQCLARMGVAMTFDDGEVAVLTRGMAGATGKPMREILADKNVIIDAAAANEMQQRGLLKEWGLRRSRAYRYERNERLSRDRLNGDAKGVILPTSRFAPPEHVNAYIIDPGSGVKHRVLSEIIDCNERVHGAGIVMSEQPGGRRCCLLPFSLDNEAEWGFGVRKLQLRGILDWLAGKGKNWPVWVDEAFDLWPIVYRPDADERMWVGLINFGHDAVDDAVCRVAVTGKATVNYLDDQGQLQTVHSRYVRVGAKEIAIELRDGHAVRPFDVRLLIIEPEEPE